MTCDPSSAKKKKPSSIRRETFWLNQKNPSLGNRLKLEQGENRIQGFSGNERNVVALLKPEAQIIIMDFKTKIRN